MKRTLATITIAIVAISGGVMAVAGVTAPKSDATSSLCHSTALSIKAPTSVTAGSTIKVTGAEARTPGHSVKATLQSRLSTSKKWVNGASATIRGTYSLKWKAPAKKGTYKIRVRVAHLSASNTSPIKNVTVK